MFCLFAACFLELQFIELSGLSHPPLLFLLPSYPSTCLCVCLCSTQSSSFFALWFLFEPVFTCALFKLSVPFCVADHINKHLICILTGALYWLNSNLATFGSFAFMIYRIFWYICICIFIAQKKLYPTHFGYSVDLLYFYFYFFFKFITARIKYSTSGPMKRLSIKTILS